MSFIMKMRNDVKWIMMMVMTTLFSQPHLAVIIMEHTHALKTSILRLVRVIRARKGLQTYVAS